jgi:starch synthase/alpha-amylase
VDQNRGNGFLFKNFDSRGLLWAIEQAMDFYNLPKTAKARQIRRIMQESAAAFTHANTARQYIKLYEKMLKRPLVLQNGPDPGAEEKSDTPKD